MNDERLAAYLSGDLEPDEHAEIAALLAGDAALRARADRIAAADRALGELGDVDLPDGFSDRLRAAIRPALDEVLGDELAARRARRALPARWVTAGAAAAVVAAVGIGALLTGLPDTGDDIAAMTADGEAVEDAAGLAVPEIVALGRDLSEEDLRALASSQQYTVALSSSLSSEDADAFAARSQDAMGGQTLDAPAYEADTQQGATTGGELGGDMLDTTAVSTCLPVVIGSSELPLAPLYAELATFRGEDVVVFVVLGPRGGSDHLSRVEVWVLSAADCETRYFTQHDG